MSKEIDKNWKQFLTEGALMGEHDDINRLIDYLESSLEMARNLKMNGPDENMDFGSLVLSIQDGLNEFPI